MTSIHPSIHPSNPKILALCGCHWSPSRTTTPHHTTRTAPETAQCRNVAKDSRCPPGLELSPIQIWLSYRKCCRHEGVYFVRTHVWFDFVSKNVHLNTSSQVIPPVHCTVAMISVVICQRFSCCVCLVYLSFQSEGTQKCVSKRHEIHVKYSEFICCAGAFVWILCFCYLHFCS